MDIFNLIRVLINRLPIVVIISLAAAVVTGSMIHQGPKKYRSYAQLSTGFTIQNTYSLTDERFNRVVADLKFNNLIEIMSSPILIQTLSHHLLLHDLKEATKFSNFSVGRSENWPQQLFQIPRDSLVQILTNKVADFDLLSSYDSTEQKVVQIIRAHGFHTSQIRSSLSIKRVNYTDYLLIGFESENPYLSAYIVNKLGEEFVRYNNIMKYSQSSESIKFLDRISEQKRKMLEDKSNDLREYKSRNQFLNFEYESEAKIGQLQGMEEQRNTTLTNINRINLSIELLDTKLSDKYPVNKEFIKLRKRLTYLNGKRRGQLGDFKALTDSITSVRNRLDYLLLNSYALDKEILKEREDLGIELQVEEGKLTSLNERIEIIQNQLSSFASTEATINFLQRDADIAAQEYLEVQKKLNDVQNAIIGSSDLIKIIVRGQPALGHQPSGLFLKSAFAFVACFVFGFSIVVFLELIDSRMKTSIRYSQLVKTKLLGIIRDESKKKKRGLFSFIKMKILNSKPEPATQSVLGKIRLKMTSQDAKIWLWSSLNEKEGKSHVLYLLAKSLALTGKRTLIIDTNLRSSFFSSDFKFDEKIPLKAKVAEYLNLKSQSNTNKGVFSDHVIVSSDQPNVHILQNTNYKGSPAEAMSGIDFLAVLDLLSEEYDHLFLEGASIRDHPDSIELSQYADKVILVFDAMTGFKLAEKQLLKSLNRFDGKLLGGILNKAIN